METSRLQSLDNFAAGKRVQTNVCAGNPALSTDAGLQQLLQEVERRIVDQDSNAETKAQYRKSVRDAFSALPPFAQSQFLALGGQVLLSKDANKLCTASVMGRGQCLKRSDDELKLLREGYADVKACFVLANPAELEATSIAPKSKLHMIIIANQPAEVSHNFVRVFGYRNAQLSARMAVQGDLISRDTQAVLTANYSQKFETSRRQIALKLSYAANAAWRPAADVPVIDTVLKPAIKYADAYGGASINNSGRGELLTNSQRMRLAASGTADISPNIAGGMVADAAGKKIGTYGAQKFADIAFETGAGRRIVHEVIETAPTVGKTVLKYGDQAVNYVVGGAGKKIVDN
jgi:hypothetical protein